MRRNSGQSVVGGDGSGKVMFGRRMALGITRYQPIDSTRTPFGFA